MFLKSKICIRLYVALCLAVSFISTHAYAADKCQPGTYSETGNVPCIQAPLGRYVPNIGATSAITAKPGFYVPERGASAPTKADPGFFVDREGAFSQTPASVGTYVPEAGASMATLAEPGFFVAETGQSSQTPAPAGTYVSMPGANSAQACPQDSMSFGSAPACRAGLISAFNPSTIGPQFDSGFGTNGAIDFGILEIGAPASLSFKAMNASSDLGMGNLLTDLMLNRVDFIGEDANLFSSSNFVANTLLRELDSFTFNIDIMPTSAQTIKAMMAINTDQFAAPGEVGKTFFFNLSGVIESANSVSAPVSISLFLGMMVLILLRVKP